MVGYSPWGHKELDTTEWRHSLTHYMLNFMERKKMEKREILIIGSTRKRMDNNNVHNESKTNKINRLWG